MAQRPAIFQLPLIRWICAILFFLAIPLIGFAAATGPSTSPTTQAGPPPTSAFPLADAATQAESVTVTLRGIENLLSNDRDTANIDADIKTLTSEIDGRLDETQHLLTSSPSLQLLGEQEQDWSAIGRELAGWKRDLNGRLVQLKNATVDVTQLKSDWDAEKTAADYWLPRAKSPQIVETAEASIAQIESAIGQTSQDLLTSKIAVVALQQEVDGQAARVLDILDAVHDARNQAFSRLLVRNSRPLWTAVGELSSNRHLVEQGQQSFGRQLQAVHAYLDRRVDNVAAQIVLLVVLIIGLYLVLHRTRQWAVDQPQLEHATRVFNSPIATAILLALLASAYLYPQAPRLLWAGIEAAALIPTVIILRRLIDRRWFSLLDALVVFYFLDQLRAVAAIVPILARLLLLIEMLGGFLLLLSFRLSTGKTPQNTQLAKIVRFARWIWLAHFLLAFVSGVVGYVSLANLLGDAALGSLYLAVILYAATVIASGFIVIILHSYPFAALAIVGKHQHMVQQRVNHLLTWGAIIAWAIGVLTSLSVATAAYELTRNILSFQVGYEKNRLSLGNLLEFVLTLWASVLVSRLIRFILEEDVYDRFVLPGGVSYGISKMLNYAILSAGFFIALTSLGVDLTKFAILGSAFLVGLGFGLQTIFNNFASGLILLFERPVKIGDVIQMGDTTGTVEHIGIRASIIRTTASAEIIIPNGNLISNNVTNWTLSNRQRGIEITLATGAAADPKHVIELLTRVAAAHPLIIKSPAPQAFLSTFATDSFSYLLRAWTNNADQWIEIRSELSVAIHAALTKENIPIR